MKRSRRSCVFALCVGAMLSLFGCGTVAPATREPLMERPAGTAAMPPTPAPTAPSSAGGATPEPGGGHGLPLVQPRPNRMIIKNAEMALLVADTDHALDLVTQIAGDAGGYMLSSRIWYEDWLDHSYKYAAVTMGVPVNAFEATLRRLRGLAVQVVDETAAGQDVTDEYVDLESRLRNLEATRDRIRAFLDQAGTVDEALRVNEQLKTVEGEIEQVQGRMNYLYDRSGYSTVAVQLRPELPPMPTPATPTPTPTPAPWSAAPIAREAAGTLTSVVQGFATIAIWLAIVVLPLALPALGVVLVVRALRQRPQGGAPTP